MVVACSAPYIEIHKASRAGDAEQVEKLLAKNPRLAENAASEGYRVRPLHEAKTRRVAELLVQAGAGLSSQDNIGREPIHTAPSGEVVDFLVEKGISPTRRYGADNCTALHGAESASGVEALVRHGLDPNAESYSGLTPLHVQARSISPNVPEVIAALVRSGAQLEATGSGGVTPLIFARPLGVKALAAAGANLEARDKHGVTALHHAAYAGQAETVEALLDAGANPSSRLPPDAVLYDGHLQMKVANIGNATPLGIASGDKVRAILKKRGAE